MDSNQSYKVVPVKTVHIFVGRINGLLWSILFWKFILTPSIGDSNLGKWFGNHSFSLLELGDKCDFTLIWATKSGHLEALLEQLMTVLVENLVLDEQGLSN